MHALAPVAQPAFTQDWDLLDRWKHQDEAEAVAGLLARAPLAGDQRSAVVARAEALVVEARASAKRSGVVESFLQQFSLSTKEGLVLMGLAEALLRTPDEDTKDALIAEKISSADWASHVGKSENVLVNASAWGLMLTARSWSPTSRPGATWAASSAAWPGAWASRSSARR
jgi:RHH-type proline utilization regulon transcriptional repressor/proline dehydrogenase/delta 1-pyrroline-5-carboxylate dehydrogenase